MAYAIGGISGCHINPAVTTGVFAAGRMSGKDAIGYIVVQLIGATLGAGFLYILASGIAGWTMPEWGLGSNDYGHGYQGNYNVASALLPKQCLPVFSFLYYLRSHQSMATMLWQGWLLDLHLYSYT
jgi:aquaporin Z